MQQRRNRDVRTKPVLTMIDLPVDPSPSPSSAIARFLLGHTPPGLGTSNHPRIMTHTHALASAIAATKRKRPISKETHAYLRRELWRNHNKNKRPKRATGTEPLRIMATATAEVQTVETVNTAAQTDEVEVSAIETPTIEMTNAQTQTDATPKLETTSPEPTEAGAHPIPAPNELASLHEKMCELLHREAKANRELRADFQEMRSMFEKQTAQRQESKMRREAESRDMLEALRRDVGAICAEQLTEFCEMQQARENREMRAGITELGETFLRNMRAISEEQRTEAREMHSTETAKVEEQRAESQRMHDALAARLEKLQLDVDLEHMHLSQEVREESEKTRDVLRADISTVSENQTVSFGRALNIVGALETQLASHSQEARGEAEKTREAISGNMDKACNGQTAEIRTLFGSLGEMLGRAQAIISKRVHDESELAREHLHATMSTNDKNQTSLVWKLSNNLDAVQKKLISQSEEAGKQTTKTREQAANIGKELHTALGQMATISVEQTEVIMVLLNNVIATMEQKLGGHCEAAGVEATERGDALSGLRTLCEGMRGSFGELLDKQKRQYVRLLEEHGNTREEITKTRKEVWNMRDELLADSGAGFRDIGAGLRDLSTVCEGTNVGLEDLKNRLRVESRQVRQDVALAWEALGSSLQEMRVEQKEQHSLVLAGEAKIREKLVSTRKKLVHRIRTLNGDLRDMREHQEEIRDLLTRTGDSLKQAGDTLHGSLENMWEEIMEEHHQTKQGLCDLETGLGRQSAGCREEYLTMHIALGQLDSGQKELREQFWEVEDRLCVKLSEEGNRHEGEYHRLLDAFKDDMGALDRRIKEMIAVQLGMKTEQMMIKCLLGLVMYKCNYIRGRVEFVGNAQVKTKALVKEVWGKIEDWLEPEATTLGWLSDHVVRSGVERAAKEEERSAERKSEWNSLEQKINWLMEKAATKTQAGECSNNCIEDEEFLCSSLLCTVRKQVGLLSWSPLATPGAFH